ncbi:hypothetical protein [Halopelagius inordinatus]|uniref:hypothetical protein n=1 Tax=Halopelagius inordinatus TaxID=553467 RepID=UPI001160907B|nr:hypothetical protein [Halopelagius inordinatus]
MGEERFQFGLWDLLSVVFGGLGAGMGVGLAFLPDSLPGFLSIQLIGAIAVLLTVLSLLIQAVSIEEETEETEQETVEVPVSVYNSHLGSIREAGYYEGRYNRYREQLITERTVVQENHSLDEYREISKNRNLDEFTDTGDEEDEEEEQHSTEDEEENTNQYPSHVEKKVTKLEKEVEKELEYE